MPTSSNYLVVENLCHTAVVAFQIPYYTRYILERFFSSLDKFGRASGVLQCVDRLVTSYT